jgi:hypothetical protein
MPIEQPAHPVYALTTYELRDYRRELEHSLAALRGDTEGRGPLRERLAEVVAEQEERKRSARVGRTGTVGDAGD